MSKTYMHWDDWQYIKADHAPDVVYHDGSGTVAMVGSDETLRVQTPTLAELVGQVLGDADGISDAMLGAVLDALADEWDLDQQGGEH